MQTILVLISPSVCHLQRMIDICIKKLRKLTWALNAKKCAVLRFGNRYNSTCADANLQGSTIDFIRYAKYLRSSKRLAVD